VQLILKGDAYEKFIRNYINTFKYVSDIWLWKDIPESMYSKNKESKYLSQWLSDNQKNYKNKIYVMKNKKIYNKWSELTKMYDYLF